MSTVEERLKKVEDCIIREDMVLVQIQKKESVIIKPNEQDEPDWDYAEVLTVGNKVTDLKRGDIILMYDGGAQPFDIKGKTYAVLMRHLVKLATPSANFKK